MIEKEKQVAESTAAGAVYLDRDGKVVARNDPRKVTKISLAEAKRRGIALPEEPAAKKAVPAPPQDKAVKAPAATKAVKKG